MGPYSPVSRKVQLRGVAKNPDFDQAFILFWDWDGAIFFGGTGVSMEVSN